jgi:hypothetical protein
VRTGLPRARAGLGVGDAEELDRPAVDRAEIEQALDQRRLAGAVYAGKSEELAGRELQVDVAQHLGPAEALGEPADADDWVAHGKCSWGRSLARTMI